MGYRTLKRCVADLEETGQLVRFEDEIDPEDLEPGENVGQREVASFVQERADRGEIRQGRIPLQPCWHTDYRQLVSSHIAILAAEHVPVP